MRQLIPPFLLLVVTCAPASEPGSVQGWQLPIVGGSPAPDTLAPAAGALVVDLPGNYRVFCSGALIGDQLVLTAAHCFDNLPAGSPLGFFAGLSIQPTDPNPPLAPVASVHLCPDYTGGEAPDWLDNYNDIALVKLTANPAVKPVLLVRADEVAQLVKIGGGVMLLGFGQTVAGAKTSTGTKSHGVSTIGQVGDHEFHVVGSGAPQKCHGDSGGPTLGDLDQGPGYDFRLIGVTSRADTDCTLGSIETRVDPHLSWIHGTGGSSIPCGSGLNPACPEPPKKGLGEPCSAPADCVSGLCVSTGEGTICSEKCSLADNDCPDGHDCLPVAGSSDTGACVPASAPPKKKQGETCLLGSECEGGLCAYLAGHRFCTEVCGAQAPCPSGMVCMLARDRPQYACVPETLVPLQDDDDVGCNYRGGSPVAGASFLFSLLLFAGLPILSIWIAREARGLTRSAGRARRRNAARRRRSR